MKIRFYLAALVILLASIALGACAIQDAQAEGYYAQEPQDTPSPTEIFPTPIDEAAIVDEEASPQDIPSETTNNTNDVSGQLVSGWLGYVLSLPQGSQYDDYLVLSPEGTGEIGLTGVSLQIEEQIVALRDHDEPGKYAHFWGILNCNVMDYKGCQLVVSRIRSGATNTEPEQIEAWEGTLISQTFNSGDSSVFVLEGDFPMWFSIHSNDETILSQIENLRDSGTVVRVWGDLMTGIPDVNGSRIQANRIEIITPGNNVQPEPSPQTFSPAEDWPEFCSEHYGYCIRYPDYAELKESGVMGVPTDEIPDGLDLDTYVAQLEETYGKDICIQIQLPLAYLYISSPANQEFRYAICGRTGVGAGEMVEKSEDVMVGDRSYTFHGFEIQYGGESTSAHNETLFTILPDGTRIEYGCLPREDATFEDYLMKGKEMILQILQTYKQTP
jgi:hypothetical protein